MRKAGHYRQILTLLVCAALFFTAALPGFAEDADKAGLLDDKALTELVEGFLKERGIPAERVGIGFYFPETEEEWFYNPDTWFYPASVYKVPLMMILAERVSAGMVSPDEKIGGLPLDKLFNYIIVHSNNDYAHEVRRFLGGDEAWREEAKQYADLPDDYYDPDYMDYCYFSPRYITRVMETLYRDPDRFPDVIDCMREADPTHYFQQQPEMYDIPIAQKYGSYVDMQNTNWNHTTGIIYTPHPFILTVMTENVTGYEGVLGKFAVLFKDYVLGLDDQLAALERQREEEARQAELLAAEQAELEAQASEEAAPSVQQRQAGPQETEERRSERPKEEDARERRRMLFFVSIALTGLLVLGLLCAALIGRIRKKKRYEGYRRRFEEELRQEALARERKTR